LFGIQLREADLCIRLDERLLVDPADALERAHVKRILRPAVARTLALEFAVRFFLARHPPSLRLGENVAFLGHLRFERLQAMPHRDYVVAHPDVPDASARDRVPLFREFVGHAVLAPGGLLQRERNHALLKIGRESVAQIGLASTDFPQGFFTPGCIQLLEPVDAVAAVAHDLAGLRRIPELLRQIEDPDLGVDDLLLSRHHPS